MRNVELNSLVGRSPDGLHLTEKMALAGKWIAIEIYSPETLPLREIAALGDSAEDCIRALARRGLDPVKYEFQLMTLPG
jgi:hypothetical protein